MLKNWLSKKRKKQNRIRLFFRTILEGTKDSDIYPKKTGTEQQPQLYDTPRKINVETFFEIMTTGNLLLLKVNPGEKVSEKRLSDAWLDLQEYYYSNTNNLSFKRFKENLKKALMLEAEISACWAALVVIEFGDEDGYELLKKSGISSMDEKAIRSVILRKETKLELIKSRLGNNDKKEAVNFYKIVASVESGLNRQLNLSEINLERWVAYLSELKDKNDEVRKQTNTKRWRGK